MTTTIESVTMYKCPETGRVYKTKKGAENSAKRVREERKRELLATGFDPSQLTAQQDYVRLNATSPRHIIELVTEKAEEFWGLAIKKFDCRRAYVMYSEIKNYMVISLPSCTIEVDAKSSCRLEYMRRKAKLDKGWFTEPYISDLLFRGMGFRGFETGSGCPGRCSNVEGSGYPFNMSLEARLDQFPIIHKRFQEWQAHKNEYDQYMLRRKHVEFYGSLLASSTPEYGKLKELENYHDHCSSIIQNSIKSLVDHHKSGILDKWDRVNPKAVRDSELWEMFG